MQNSNENPLQCLFLPKRKIKGLKTKGIIFDFNGTLFWDTSYHDLAWDIFLENHQIKLTNQEKAKKIHGKSNADILKGIFSKEISNEDIFEMTMEKEKIYHNICLKTKMEYAPGAIEFIKYLRLNNIKYTIATSSGWENIDFYIENMDLEKWFDIDLLVYNDGSFRGKPYPDIFIKAIDKLQIKGENILIFEDSIAGIQAAEYSSAGQIIVVNSNNGNYEKLPYQVITNFNQVKLT